MRRDELNEEPPVEDNFDEGEEERERLREALNARLADSLKWDLTEVQPEEPLPQKRPEAVEAAEGDGGEGTETEEDEPPETFEFRMFGSSKPATTVVLEKDRPFKPGQGTIIARRPTSFYFARPSPQTRKEFESVLVTWEQIMEKSQQRAWGLERPWKTIASITVSDGKSKNDGKGPSTAVAEAKGEEKKGRKRLGKKTRIIRRKRERASAAKKEAEEKARLEKEEHVKAKKKRLNHVKKLRARAKAKEKKAAARAAGEEVEGEDGGSSADEAAADISMEGA